jgi:hypothetical protein
LIPRANYAAGQKRRRAGLDPKPAREIRITKSGDKHE